MSTGSPMPPRPTPVVFCSNCGAQVTVGQNYCPKCAAPQPASGTVPVVAAAAMPVQYGGFWIRFVAWLLDAIILGIVLTPFRIMMFGGVGLSSLGMGRRAENPVEFLAVLLPLLGMSLIFNLAAQWLYEALLTSSSKQATVGKMACGLRVTDLYGRRLTFARASGRYFAKLLSAITCFIGYIIAGFTQRKQALHDFVAGTLVIKG